MSIVKELLFYCNVATNQSRNLTSEIIPYFDLTFVLKGELTYIINGEKCVLRENDAILLRPNTVRERLGDSHPVKYVSFNFLMNEEINIDPYSESIINSDIRKLIAIFPQSHLSPSFHSKEKLEGILNYILYEMIDISLFKSKNQNVIKILKYIENNIALPLTLTQISQAVNLSKEYTANLFKKEMGKTIIEYINEQKMLLAKNMIDNGETSLNDIAVSLGFENYSYFSKVFKKCYGIPPVKMKANRACFNGEGGI